eukprot:gb/GEZN01004774.1/.p1 GENE.gb/GEZN01004774.1/~~gb/GEZN01004774.1/.p1  ORF type:complete len:475 (-),score=49.09 gb/GEZN01004774.1/:368-1792(-)
MFAAGSLRPVVAAAVCLTSAVAVTHSCYPHAAMRASADGLTAPRHSSVPSVIITQRASPASDIISDCAQAPSKSVAPTHSLFTQLHAASDSDSAPTKKKETKDSSGFGDMIEASDNVPKRSDNGILRSLTGIPGASGFGSASTAWQVAAKYSKHLEGKVVVVTGPSIGGLGFESCRAFLSVGAKVVLLGRSPSKGAEALKALRTEFPDAKVAFLPCDLLSLKSVRACAQALQKLPLIQDAQGRPQLHILLNNAGIMAKPFGVSEDGYEQQFAACHLGHFLLTELLLPIIKQTVQTQPNTFARIVNVSSTGHCMLKKQEKEVLFGLEEIKPRDATQATPHYHSWAAYGRAKLSNILHAQYLAEQLAKEAQAKPESPASRIQVFSVMPGGIMTGLSTHLEWPWWSLLLVKPMFKSPEQGAATQVYACACPPGSDSLPPSGSYLEDCNLQSTHPWASDHSLQDNLIKISREACARFL